MINAIPARAANTGARAGQMTARRAIRTMAPLCALRAAVWGLSHAGLRVVDGRAILIDNYRRGSLFLIRSYTARGVATGAGLRPPRRTARGGPVPKSIGRIASQQTPRESRRAPI
jgi:hypothetical protein